MMDTLGLSAPSKCDFMSHLEAHLYQARVDDGHFRLISP